MADTKDNKDLKTNKEEKNLVLIIENANTSLKKILTDCFMQGLNKIVAKVRVDALIQETKKLLIEAEASEELIASTELGLKQTFMREWRETITLLKNYAKKDNSGILAHTLAQMLVNENTIGKVVDSGGMILGDIGNGEFAIANGSITNLRDFMTDVELGAGQRYVEYADKLEEAMVKITEQISNGSLSATYKRKNPNKPNGEKITVRKSLRNMAEIETRAGLIVEDVERQGLKKNKDYVCASSHANCSERCSWWQGKIFLLDIDVSTRTFGQYDGKQPEQDIIDHIDGRPVYSLKQACENGFLSYNCQHRLVKYYKGINPPQYDPVKINKERSVTARQRELENRIRKYKLREEIAPEKLHTKYLDPFTRKSRKMSYRRYNQLMSKYWMEQYEKLSKKNNLPIYYWRTRITLTEREMRNL